MEGYMNEGAPVDNMDADDRIMALDRDKGVPGV